MKKSFVRRAMVAPAVRGQSGGRPALLFIFVIALVVGSHSHLVAQAASWEQIPIPKLPEFKPQQPRRIELPNGMVVFLQEDHELPLIDGSARIRGGSFEVPANKAGLAEIYGEVWRIGGTKTMNGDQMDDFLEARAAKVETGDGLDFTTIGWSCLKEDFDDVFKLFVDLLQNPEFRADKIDIAKKGLYTGISRRNDEPQQIAYREAAKLVYGSQSPYARVPEYATVAAVTRDDLVNWHHTHVHPNNIILGVVGDFDSAAMEARLRQAFGKWQKGPAVRKPDAPPSPAKTGYFLVDKSDVNQSNIQMVGVGAIRRSPDYYAISVFNEAFGGGFSSRLFGDIRSTKGLAYGVGGGVGTAWDHPGTLRIVMGTKSKTTAAAIEALDEEIAQLKVKPISDEEIKRAKDSILNSFIFNFDTPSKVLQEKMAYEFYGYPLDFLETYQKKIEQVTKEDVARVAEKYMHREKMSVLVVGNTKEFDKPLSTFGSVTTLDVSIPPPPGVTPEPGEQE
jgi:zinc protease